MTGGQRSALIIACDDYKDPGLSRLRAPAYDAQQLAEVLGDPEVGGFEVCTSMNEPAHVIGESVEEFFADRATGDLLLLHFSCHGVKDEDGELYFASSTTKLRRLGATALAASFVRRRMERSRSRRIVLLLDCCYAGAFERGTTHRAGGGMNLEEQLGGRGHAVMTASNAMEYAFEGGELADADANRPSLFTGALVEGLRTGEADRDQDGRITFDDLYEYVYTKVRAVSPNQTPLKWAYGVQGSLYLARRNRPLEHPMPLPNELTQLLDNPLSSVRIAAVGELEKLVRGGHFGLAEAAAAALGALADDDSRRVSAAARSVLSTGAPAPVPLLGEHPRTVEHTAVPHTPAPPLAEQHPPVESGDSASPDAAGPPAPAAGSRADRLSSGGAGRTAVDSGAQDRVDSSPRGPRHSGTAIPAKPAPGGDESRREGPAAPGDNRRRSPLPPQGTDERRAAAGNAPDLDRRSSPEVGMWAPPASPEYPPPAGPPNRPPPAAPWSQERPQAMGTPEFAAVHRPAPLADRPAPVPAVTNIAPGPPAGARQRTWLGQTSATLFGRPSDPVWTRRVAGLLMFAAAVMLAINPFVPYSTVWQESVFSEVRELGYTDHRQLVLVLILAALIGVTGSMLLSARVGRHLGAGLALGECATVPWFMWSLWAPRAEWAIATWLWFAALLTLAFAAGLLCAAAAATAEVGISVRMLRDPVRWMIAGLGLAGFVVAAMTGFGRAAESVDSVGWGRNWLLLMALAGVIVPALTVPRRLGAAVVLGWCAAMAIVAFWTKLPTRSPPAGSGGDALLLAVLFVTGVATGVLIAWSRRFRAGDAVNSQPPPHGGR